MTKKSSLLVVDLDGTLLKSDLLWECLLRFLIPKGWRIIQVLAWIFQGGPSLLKAQLAHHVKLDASTLPWNESVVLFCEKWVREGGRVVIATASNQELTQKITQHFSFVSVVIGSTSTWNGKGDQKALRLVETYGVSGFDYMADSSADIPVWKVSQQAWFVGSKMKHRSLQRSCAAELHHLAESDQSLHMGFLKAIRPHQWLKNVLVFVPLIAAHRWSEIMVWQQTLPAFFSLCCMASASYLWNDMADIEADRRHPAKKHRPIASGSQGIPVAVLSMFGLFSLGILAAWSAGLIVVLASLAYFFLSLIYTIKIKTIPVFDVLFLSGLYTYRMVLGGLAASVMISPWLLAFSTAFFLGLAFLKRYVELSGSDPKEANEVFSRRGYVQGDSLFILIAGLCSSFFSIVVLALYLDSSASKVLYQSPERLWGIALALLAWNLYVWFLALRKKMCEDPVWFAARDPVTYGLAFLSLLSIVLSGPRA